VTLPTLEANSLVDRVTTAWRAKVYNGKQCIEQSILLSGTLL